MRRLDTEVEAVQREELRIMNPALASSTSVSVSSPMTSALVQRRARRPPLPPRAALLG
jgi:hypothetical protein